MRITSKSLIPYTIAGALACAVAVSALAPAEQRLGDTVKLIYLHASITWVSLVAFLVAAAIGIAALVFRSERLSRWSIATLSTATAYWVIHFSLGLVTMRLAWGGWFWSEPRIRAGLLILGFAIAATLVAMASENRWLGPLLSIGLVGFVVVLLSTVGRVFHPTAAIRDSNSLAIKTSVLVIVSLVIVAAVQLTRLLRALRYPVDDCP